MAKAAVRSKAVVLLLLTFCLLLLPLWESVIVLCFVVRLVMVERLFLAVPQGCLQFVIVVFPDHTHLLFWKTRCEQATKYLASLAFYRFFSTH